MEDMVPAVDEEIGKQIGPYRLIEKIGEGGGGSIYLAEQSAPIRRQVAFKIIKLGMDTKSVIARFEAERQMLAMMEHPHIAKVFNAGATEKGRPYFVMELVHGTKVTSYCDENRLDVSQRLELFIQICHAIQHAHRKGIIHRDIKTDQDWIAETPVGDWFYGPGFTYSADAVIRYLLEEVTRDGNIGLCVSLLPDGSLDSGSSKMLKEIGEWMRINGEGIYGSHAWKVLGEGADGKLNVLPGGKIGGRQANHRFTNSDFRFTVGNNGDLYAWCMTVPEGKDELRIVSLGKKAGLLDGKIRKVELLGYRGAVKWKQLDDTLVIQCPYKMPFSTAVGFRISAL